MRDHLKAIASIFVLGGLSACAVSPDLVREPGKLSPEQQFVVQQAANMTAQYCLVGRVKETGGTKEFVGGVKMTQEVQIRRIYASNTDWYKLQGVTRGIWDHVYYNRKTQELVCGDVNWERGKKAEGVVFEELLAH